jgi:hypothetical protein
VVAAARLTLVADGVMKVIIAGSRRIGLVQKGSVLVQGRLDALLTRLVHAAGFEVSEVVSGGAKGVDTAGELWAALNGISVKRFIPDWDGHAGKRAGLVRNCRMAEYADALIAVWDGQSRGTAHMIEEARRRGLKVHVEIVR